MIYGFDWDGTLVDSFGSTPLPGARAALDTLPTGAQTFIATNQAGPVFRAVTRQAKYPTVEMVCENLRAGLAMLGWRPDLFVLCCHPGKDTTNWQRAAERVGRLFHHQLAAALGTVPYAVFIVPTFRKPQPGMLTYAAGYFKASASGLVYVGDREDDRVAARRAGCRFVDAAEWREGGVA